MTRFIAITGSGSSQRGLLTGCIEELKGKGYQTFERFSGESWQDLVDLLQTGGLFEERRAVVVESPDQMGPVPVGLFRESAEKDPSVICILVCEKDTPKGLTGLPRGSLEIRKPEKVPFWIEGRTQWLEKEARSRKIRMTRGAVQLLAEWIEEPEVLLSELRKLGIAAEGAEIDEALVETLVVDEGGKQMLALLDGLCRGETRTVLQALSSLRKREEPLKIISALHKRMRIAMYLSRVTPALGQELDAALEVKPYQGKMAKRAAAVFPKRAIRDFVLSMARESAASKSGLGRGWDGIELEILRLLSSTDKQHGHGKNVPPVAL